MLQVAAVIIVEREAGKELVVSFYNLMHAQSALGLPLCDISDDSLTAHHKLHRGFE